MLEAGIENAPTLKYWLVVGFERSPLCPETQSGRWVLTERCEGFVPEGSETLLGKYGVSQGPVCNSVTVVTRQPPTRRLAPRPISPKNFLPRPSGKS